MNLKIIKIIALSLTISTSTFAQTVNLQKGLVAYFPFNRNANDESGNGNNGTVYGASLTADRNGKTNSAYSFNGNSSYIKIPHKNIYNSANLTISCWLFNRSDNISDGRGIIYKSKNTGKAEREFGLEYYSRGDKKYIILETDNNSAVKPDI